MLQQTTVAAAIPYFEAFTARWPDVAALAAAPLDDILTGWAGLGYYARARNLHACARRVAGTLGGRFPDTEQGLAALPGIGPYTAAAITAIAFDRPATVVDGNVERVIARRFAVTEPLPAAKPSLRRLAATLTPPVRPGDYAQAIMDLGATVCAPTRPRCLACPWAEACEGRAAGIAETLPRRAAKPERPTRRGVAYWAVDRAGRVLVRRRPPCGLLGGMTEVPSSEWVDARPSPRAPPAPPSDQALAAAAPVTAIWGILPGVVRHTFTHFHLELLVAAATAPVAPAVAAAADGVWVPVDRLGEQALPSVMRKVVRHALAHAARFPPIV